MKVKVDPELKDASRQVRQPTLLAPNPPLLLYTFIPPHLYTRAIPAPSLFPIPISHSKWPPSHTPSHSPSNFPSHLSYPLSPPLTVHGHTTYRRPRESLGQGNQQQRRPFGVHIAQTSRARIRQRQNRLADFPALQGKCQCVSVSLALCACPRASVYITFCRR